MLFRSDAELIRRCAEAEESDKLNPDRDPHAYVASLAFGTTYTKAFAKFVADGRRKYYDKAKRKPTEAYKTLDALRTIAKRVVYGLNYGAGSRTVLESIYDGGYDGPPLSIQLIDRVTNVYFTAFEGVPTWRNAQLKLANETQSVASPIVGRHRIFPLGDIDATVVYNYPIQSGAADIVSTQLIKLHRELPYADPTAFLIAQVHDAVYAECDAKRADAVAECIESYMSVELALVEGAAKMPYPASAQIADNWRDAA